MRNDFPTLQSNNSPALSPNGEAEPDEPPSDVRALKEGMSSSPRLPPHAVQQSQVLTANAFPAYMAAVAGPSFSGLVESAGFAAYRDQILRDAGNPADPLERMLLEQAALAHLHIGLLHAKAAAAETADSAKVYLGAACRMQSEFRRLALALNELRSPPKQKSFTVVKQANVAAGDQRIAIVKNRQTTRKQKVPLSDSGAQLPTNGALTDDRPNQTIFQPTANCGEPAELATSERIDRRRPAATPRRRKAK